MGGFFCGFGRVLFWVVVVWWLLLWLWDWVVDCWVRRGFRVLNLGGCCLSVFCVMVVFVVFLEYFEKLYEIFCGFYEDL